MKTKKILYWILEPYNTSTQKGLNDDNEEQQYFLNGPVCLFIILTQ